MKPAALIVMLAAVAFGADPSKPPAKAPAKAPLAHIAAAEKIINKQFAALYPDEPYFVLGLTRGVYLDSFGVVFSTEINLAAGPTISPIHTVITAEEKKNYRDKKLSRLPKLKTELYSILGQATATLHPTPQDDNLVLGVTLFRYEWENAAGIPSQIVLQTHWSQVLEAQRKGAPLDSVVRMYEY